MVQENPTNDEKAILRKQIFHLTLSVTLTCDIQAWIIYETQHHFMVDICTKSYENQAMDAGGMLWKRIESTVYGIRSTAHLKPLPALPPSTSLFRGINMGKWELSSNVCVNQV